ncbi:TolC family protein [Aureispira sp. CCB-QB1]|uniref:TolC family protein n=1 Tax=Aureispira sp. CCB-QB1 TaxID=1313421 RepID=UPI000698360C|nr:TolC family protein [Aureispira sp. CCB-QB1]
MHRFILITTLFVIMCWRLNAQRVISLEEAIEQVKTQHPTILQQDLYIQQQRILKDAGKNQPFLSLGYSMEELGAAGTGVHALYAQQDFNLPQVAKRKSVYQEALAQTGEWQKVATQKQLERSVAALYQQLLFLKSQEGLNKELLIVYDKIETIAKKRAKVGETGAIPLITTQSAKQQIEWQQMNLEQDYTNQLILLQQILMDSSIIDVADTSLTPSSSRIAPINLDKHPLVEQIHQSKLANDLQSEVIESQLLPQLSTGIQLQVAEGTFPNFGGQIGLNVPLFAKGIKAQVQANTLNSRMLEQRKVWQLQQLQSQQKIAVQNIRLLTKQLSYFETVLLPTLQQQQALNQQAFSIGELDYLNVLQGLEQIIEVKRRYLQLVLQLNLAWVDYNYLLES